MESCQIVLIKIKRPIDTIYGNLQGLKPSQVKQLQRLYQQKIPPLEIVDTDFAQRLGAISAEINQPLCAYINRRGQVIRIGVGTPRQTQIPPLELPRYGAERLSGIRCLTTQLKEEVPNQSSLTAMVMQRLDTLVTLTVSGEGFARRGGGVTGYIKEVYLAHLLPEPEKWSVSDALSLDALSEENFLELVEQLETQFRREYVARQVDVDQERVILIGLMTAKITEAQFESSLAELERLVDSAGGEVLEIIRQKRSHVDPQSVVGSGKVEEIALIAQTLGANVIVFDRSLSPAQVKNLEQQIGVRVVDRTEVILDIFAQRAQSRAGKLQVELAQLEYMLPRLTGRGKTMSKLGGGIGTRGPGETKLETERRAIQQRINKLQKEVTQLQAHRSRLRQKRQHHDIPTVAIIGYTNAGKSTLINALTNAEVYTADQLFATLDPTTRRLSVANEDTGDLQTILLTDTVGFIEQLPPSLVDAFRATLEEVTEADTLLHVVDISHPDWLNQLQAVNKIIKDMSSFPTYTLLAFNKIDQVSPEVMDIAREQFPDALFISASQRLGLDNLRSSLLQI